MLRRRKTVKAYEIALDASPYYDKGDVVVVIRSSRYTKSKLVMLVSDFEKDPFNDMRSSNAYKHVFWMTPRFLKETLRSMAYESDITEKLNNGYYKEKMGGV